MSVSLEERLSAQEDPAERGSSVAQTRAAKGWTRPRPLRRSRECPLNSLGDPEFRSVTSYAEKNIKALFRGEDNVSSPAV